MDDNTTQQGNGLRPLPSLDTQDKRRAFAIVTGIGLVILLIIVLLYVLFRKPSTPKLQNPAFPIAGNVNNQVPINNQGGENNGASPSNGGVAGPLQKLVELYKGPVAGYTLLDDGKTIRAFDREKGRLVEIDTTSGAATIVSDQPILQIHDATFLADQKIILRTLDTNETIKSTLYTIGPSGAAETPLSLQSPVALSDDILELAPSEDGSKVVFVIKDPLGADIDVLDVTTQSLTRATTLPIDEWLPMITDDGTIYLSAKASRFASTGTYKVVNKHLVMVVAGATGQTTSVAPNATAAFDSWIDATGFHSDLRGTTVDTQAENPNISFTTIAEKCAWTRDSLKFYCGVPLGIGNTAPDDWYLGVYRFSDALQSYDVQTGNEDYLVNPETQKVQIDMIDLLPSSFAVFFKNKPDEHLWMYRLTTADTSASQNAASSTGTTTPSAGE